MAPILWTMNTVIFQYGYFTSLIICLFIAIAYVSSFYIFTKNELSRDHPTTIKLRFVRVGILSAVALPFLHLCSSNSNDVRARTLLEWLGLRGEGILQALVLPLLLTMILFLGPLYLHYLDGIFPLYRDPHYWRSNINNIIWLRNHVVAPLSEEFAFRSCMLPLLVPAFGEFASIIICPLFFGVGNVSDFLRNGKMLAHFHHLREKLKEGMELKSALLQSAFQFSYTTLFGTYSAFLFLRTGHLIAPVIAHAFCNHMGFPDFVQVLAHREPTRYFVMAAFVLGLILWYYLLFPLTSPSLFSNNIYFL